MFFTFVWIFSFCCLVIILSFTWLLLKSDYRYAQTYCTSTCTCSYILMMFHEVHVCMIPVMPQTWHICSIYATDRAFSSATFQTRIFLQRWKSEVPLHRFHCFQRNSAGSLSLRPSRLRKSNKYFNFYVFTVKIIAPFQIILIEIIPRFKTKNYLSLELKLNSTQTICVPSLVVDFYLTFRAYLCGLAASWSLQEIAKRSVGRKSQFYLFLGNTRHKICELISHF